MRIGSGPAAVTPTFLLIVRKRTFLALDATVVINRDGKAAKKAGEPEDLPYQIQPFPCVVSGIVVDALGQESWVQPFKHNCLKGFFRFWRK